MTLMEKIKECQKDTDEYEEGLIRKADKFHYSVSLFKYIQGIILDYMKDLGKTSDELTEEDIVYLQDNVKQVATDNINTYLASETFSKDLYRQLEWWINNYRNV